MRTIANYYSHITLTDPRVPDLGRNPRMVFTSFYIHMVCAEDGYAGCHYEYLLLLMDDDACEANC